VWDTCPIICCELHEKESPVEAESYQGESQLAGWKWLQLVVEFTLATTSALTAKVTRPGGEIRRWLSPSLAGRM